jgi:large subunit ribosomal protein L7Ae
MKVKTFKNLNSNFIATNDALSYRGLEVYMDYYGIVEKARKSGKIDKGTNEVTKAIERGVAKAVFYAADVEPKEIVSHLSVISKEKGIPCIEVDSKQKLGIAVGIPVSASAVAILVAGDAESDLAGMKIEKPKVQEESRPTRPSGSDSKDEDTKPQSLAHPKGAEVKVEEKTEEAPKEEGKGA